MFLEEIRLINKIMRKYGYGYAHSKNLVQEPFVRDLIQELHSARYNVGIWKQRHKHVEDKSTKMFKKIQLLQQGIKKLKEWAKQHIIKDNPNATIFSQYETYIYNEVFNKLEELENSTKKQPRKS